MSYAKRYERIRQAHSGSRERTGLSSHQPADETHVLRDEIHVLPSPLPSLHPEGLNSTTGKRGLRGTPGSDRDGLVVSQGSRHSALPPEKIEEENDEDATTAEESQPSASQHASSHGEGARQAASSVDKHTDPHTTNETVAGEHRDARQMEESADPSLHAPRSSRGGGGSTPSTPLRSRKASLSTSPHPAFAFTTKEPRQPMPRTAGSRKHFESPKNSVSRSRSQSGKPTGRAGTAPSPAAHGARNRSAEARTAGGPHGPAEAFTPRSVGSTATATGSTARRSAEVESILQARLHAIAEARLEVERLVRNQSQYEEKIVDVLATLEEECRQQHEELLAGEEVDTDRGDDPASPAGKDAVNMSHADDALRQAERERDVAIQLLRQFKEEGNAVVQRMYDAVKSHEKENVRLLAAQDALQRENKQLRKLFTASTRRKKGANDSAHAGSGRDEGALEIDEESGKPILNFDELPTSSSATTSPRQPRGDVAAGERERALESQVREQKAAIAELGQMLHAADETMFALRRRVEVAEAQKQALLLQAASSSLSFLGFTKRNPKIVRGKGKVSAGESGRENTENVAEAAEAENDGDEEGEEEPELPTPMRRLLDRHPDDADVANVQDLLLAARARIEELQASWQHERAERLRAEISAQQLAMENDKNVRLLEERLQRAETPRGLTVPEAVRSPRQDKKDEDRSVVPAGQASKLEVLATGNGEEATPLEGSSRATAATATGMEAAAAASFPPHHPCPPSHEQASTTEHSASSCSSTRSTPTRQLRTAWSDAKDLTAGRASVGQRGGSQTEEESKAKESKTRSAPLLPSTPSPPSPAQKAESSAVQSVADVVVEEDTTTAVTDDLSTTMTARSEGGTVHHKPKRKRKANRPKREGSELSERTGVTTPPPPPPPPSGVPPRAPASPTAPSASVSPSAPPAAATAGGPSSTTTTTAAVKPPKPVKAYVGQKLPRDKGPSSTTHAEEGPDIPVSIPLAIPPPTPTGSFAGANGSFNGSYSRRNTNANDSSLGGGGSRASSSSRRMVLSLSPRGIQETEEGE